MLTVSDVFFNQEKLHSKSDDLQYERNQILHKIPFENIDDRFWDDDRKNPFIETDSPKTDPFIWYEK